MAGKVALVLGGAGGLGRAIARSLAAEGARVALADIDAERLSEAVTALGRDGHEALGLPWDLGDLEQVDQNVGRIERSWGPVQILVNITGGPPPSPASGLDPSQWTEAFRSMVLPVIATTDRVLPGMREGRWGRIITSTSSGVVSPIPQLAVSNTMRSALVAWSKTLSTEEAPRGVTVNVTVPGRIATPRIDYLDERRAEHDGIPVADVRQSSHAAIPSGRYGDPAEYADTVAFLASEAASYITGSVVRVDGGYVSSI